jgi:aryl-alcohol dehydrogenase-like predicted oxidoreductase
VKNFQQLARDRLHAAGRHCDRRNTDEKEAHRMLDKAAEAGNNFIDTADVYPPGAEVGGAEIVTGRWLSNMMFPATRSMNVMTARINPHGKELK